MIIHNIRLPKQSTVGDVINELKTKVGQSSCNFVCYIVALHASLLIGHILSFVFSLHRACLLMGSAP